MHAIALENIWSLGIIYSSDLGGLESLFEMAWNIPLLNNYL